MAYKVFTNGSVLNASEINENLMRQSVIVFSNAAARTAAITSPVEGMLTWLEDTNRFENYNGSAWVSAAVGTGSGLVHIASQAVSGVTAVNFNNCFSSAYFNYRVVVSGGATSRNELLARLRVGGVDASGSNYVVSGVYRDVTSLASFYTTGTAASVGFLEDQTTVTGFDVGNPFQNSRTNFSAVSNGIGSVGNILWLAGSGHNLTASYDGITILSANAFTGQVSVYGYRN
jgi:hypothetical protein